MLWELGRESAPCHLPLVHIALALWHSFCGYSFGKAFLFCLWVEFFFVIQTKSVLKPSPNLSLITFMGRSGWFLSCYGFLLEF